MEKKTDEVSAETVLNEGSNPKGPSELKYEIESTALSHAPPAGHSSNDTVLDRESAFESSLDKASDLEASIDYQTLNDSSYNKGEDSASLEKIYCCFSQANDLSKIMESFAGIKARLQLPDVRGFALYKELKSKLADVWKAAELFNLLDKRARQKEYKQQTAAQGMRVLVVGAGPIGLRTAIDCAFLGCDVVVVEKRNAFTRNNVLHLWPFTIRDLRELGAKKFFGKFCAGAIDHVST